MLRREILAVAALALISSGAAAQDTVKVGLILPMTGQQASTGKQIDAAVKLYQARNGTTVAGKKVEVILKDDTGVADVAKLRQVADRVMRTRRAGHLFGCRHEIRILVLGDHHHRCAPRLVLGPEAGQQIETVHTRQVEVEQDQIRTEAIGQRQPSGAGPGDSDPVPLELQFELVEVGDVSVIFNQQDASLNGHEVPCPSTVSARTARNKKQVLKLRRLGRTQYW